MEVLRQARPNLLSLLILTLCLRGLVPVGFMPGNGVLLELCTAQGVQTVHVDPYSGEPVDPPHGTPSECPWAAVFSHVILPDPPPIKTPIRPDTRHSAGWSDQHFASTSVFPLPPARAPPRA